MKYFFGGDAELGDGVPASRLPVGDVFPGVAVLIVEATRQLLALRVSSENEGAQPIYLLILKDAPKILRGCGVFRRVSPSESTGKRISNP